MKPDVQIVKGGERPPPHPMHLIIMWCFGAIFGIAFMYEPKKPVESPVPNPKVMAELDRIHNSIIQLQASKCVNVTTQGVTIYHTPNLGVIPVPTYDKSARKGKNNVPSVQGVGKPEAASGG